MLGWYVYMYFLKDNFWVRPDATSTWDSGFLLKLFYRIELEYLKIIYLLYAP